MQLRSGRRLVYPPPEQQGGGHRRGSQEKESSEDMISGLPEELLLEILVRLRSVTRAARAGAVSRVWRDLWTQLPELTFWCDNPLPVVSALARITRSSVDLLDINLCSGWLDEGWGGDVSLLLRSAALVFPEKLIICVIVHPREDYAVELPCLERTSYLNLELRGSFPITLPQSGEFSALKSLHLQSCCIDLSTMLFLCPCLRILNIENISDVTHAGTVIVHSPSLEEFILEITHYDICRIDIAAPVLKEVTLEVCIDKGFSLSFSAPMVKKLKWGCLYFEVPGGFGQIWRLLSVEERKLDEFHVVSMAIMGSADPNDLLDAEWSTTQAISHLPVTVFTVLELDLQIRGAYFWTNDVLSASDSTNYAKA